MATGKITGNIPSTTDIGVSSYTGTGHYFKKNVTKVGKWLHIEFAAQYDSPVPASGSLGNLPSGYRPSANRVVAAIIYAGSATNACPWAATIESGGAIKQGYTGSCCGVFIDAWVEA